MKDGESLEFTIQQFLPMSGFGIPQWINVFEWKGTPFEYLKAYVELIEVCFSPAGADADVTSSTYIKVRQITIE